MSVQEIRAYCLSKLFVTEDLPFNETTLAFRIGGKIFLLTDMDAEVVSINLKCDPAKAVELRELYTEVKPGYHMNKKHWNTIDCCDTLPQALVFELIDHSYDLVYLGLPAVIREGLKRSQ